MDKTLGHDLEGLKRQNFLQNNCDKIEEIGFMRKFTPDQISEMKEDLAEVSIKIQEIEARKKELLKEIKAELDPLTDNKLELIGRLKEKAVFTREKCYKFINHVDREVGYYDMNGILVEERTARPDESQLSIGHFYDGTNN